MGQFLASILMPFFLLCTSILPESTPPDYLITEIAVTCPGRTDPLQFTDQPTMGMILHYLRSVPLYGKADKDSIGTDLPSYTIRLTHTTGRVTEYRQLGTEYLAKNNSPPYHIDPEQGSFLIAFFDSTLYNG